MVRVCAGRDQISSILNDPAYFGDSSLCDNNGSFLSSSFSPGSGCLVAWPYDHLQKVHSKSKNDKMPHKNKRSQHEAGQEDTIYSFGKA
jgi:hypothetical protein